MFRNLCCTLYILGQFYNTDCLVTFYLSRCMEFHLAPVKGVKNSYDMIINDNDVNAIHLLA